MSGAVVNEPTPAPRTGARGHERRWPRLAASRSRHDNLALFLEALLAAVVSVLCAAWVLRLWRGNLALPLRYTPVDDTKFYLMLVKGIIDHGWYASNPSLGAPFGQQLRDYPQGGDSLNLLLIRGLALFSSNPGLVVNLFFLLTFALSSFTAHLVMRSLGVSAPSAGVAAVLFSLLAYHFFRGESHLFLSAYYAVPLAAYLFLELLGDATLFARGGSQGRRRPGWLSRRSLTTIALCVVIGSDNLYYATFAVAMLVGATIFALALRRRRALLQGLAIIALIAATVAANLAPSLLYEAEHGPNVALERSSAVNESSNEAFALTLTNLLLPAPASRFAPLRRITARYDNAIAPGYCEACYASLGTVGDVGFLWLALCALCTLVGASGWFAARHLLRHAGAGALFALALGTVGGLSSLIEILITPDIRAWNRISVMIAFFSLLAVALLLDSLIRWLRPRRWGAPVAALALAGVLAFGVYDQSSNSYIPPYTATARQWTSDAAFVKEIERRLPRGASVFQLPYVPFPEGYPETPVSDQVATYATKYEPLRGYLHSSSLRWSYGQVKGRAADWSAQLAGQPLPYVLAAVSAAGFDGLWVDPAGFEPAKALRLRTALRALLGVGPLLSPAGDLWFFDLRGYRARLERSHTQRQLDLLRERTLAPPRTACVAGGLALVNPSPMPLAVTLRVRLAHIAQGLGLLGAADPDGRASDPTGSSPITVQRRLLLAPGQTVVRVPAVLRGKVVDSQVLYATLTDDALTQFARAGGAAASTLVAGLTGPPCALAES